MKSTFNRLGNYIAEIDSRNKDMSVSNLLGVSISKDFMPSVANVIGTDLSNYKIISKNQFACSLMQVSRDGGIAVALYKEDKPAIMSPAYHLFEIATDKLIPEYLEMIMISSEFDRAAVFYAIGGVRGTLTWEEFCDMRIPVPSIEEQRKIVHDYKVITDRIELLNTINDNLAQNIMGIYFEFIKNKENWKDGKLKDLLFLTKNNIDSSEVENLPYLPIDAIPSKQLLIKNFRPSEEAQSSLITFDKNDILIGAMRVYFHRVALAPCKGVTRTTCFVLRPYNPVYLYYSLCLCNENSTIDFANSTSQGSTMPYAVWEGGLNNLSIKIPNEEILANFNIRIASILEMISSYNEEIIKLNSIAELLKSNLFKEVA
ncbi:MAG: restriction endonuclease subunit S [Bacilli bacterium]|nr:restriction endonuclease subunit S [Bacilli bacterium]